MPIPSAAIPQRFRCNRAAICGKVAQSKQEIVMRLGSIDQFNRVYQGETSPPRRIASLQAAYLGRFFAPSGGTTPQTIVEQPGGNAQTPARGTVIVAGSVANYRYALRDGMPRRFKTQLPQPDNAATEADCAHSFLVSTTELFQAVLNRVSIQRRTLDVFTREIQS